MVPPQLDQRGGIDRFFRLCFSGSLIFHLLAAWFSIGFQYADEHWQIEEFAGYKLGMVPAAHLPWEFAAQMRQALQPFAVFWLFKFLQLIGAPNPFLCSFLLRIFSALLGWFSMLFFTSYAVRKIESDYWKKILIILSSFIWFLPYVQAHFSAESVAGSVFFIALTMVLKSLEEPSIKKQNLLLISAGFLLGISFDVRYQVMFMLLGLGSWLIFMARFSFKKILLLVLPFLFMFGVEFLADRWFYGNWVFTLYNYFEQNILENKMAHFGTSPVYFYFYLCYIALIPPFSLFIMGVVIFSWVKYPRHVLSWICVPMFVGHSLISHKEIRFLYPMADAMPLLLVLPFAKVSAEKIRKMIFVVPTKILWAVNFGLLLIYTVKPGNVAFTTFKFLYDYTWHNPGALVYSNLREPYNYYIIHVDFHRPRNLQMRTFGNLAELKTVPYRRGNTLVCYYEPEREDSFVRAYPHSRLIHKSPAEFWNYMTINDTASFKKGWRIYEWIK